MNRELKQKLLNDSGNSCFGMGTYPKYGHGLGGGGGQRVKLAGTISFR